MSLEDRGFAFELDPSSSSSNLLCRLLDRALIHLREYKKYKEINDEYSQALQLYLFISSAQSFLDLGGGDRCMTQKTNIMKESTMPTNTTNQNLKTVIEYYTGVANALRKKVVQDRQRSVGSSSGSGTVLPKTVCDAVKIDYVKGSESCQYWFDTIIGLQEAKNELKNGFLNSLLYPSLYPGVSKGILLYGPPGTGKTLLAKAAVNELTARGEGCIKVLFFAPQGSDLKGKFVGESEAKIEAMFSCAQDAATSLEDSEKAKGNKVQVISIIFFDEVESIAASRSNDTTGINATTVNALLQQIDGIKTGINGRKVFTWANTNYPWLLDGAFLRRFDSSVFIDLPSERDVFEQLNLALSEYITGKTSKIISPNTENEKSRNPLKQAQGCSEDEAKKEIFAWQQQKYSKYVKVDVSSLSAVAKYASDNQFSGSDVRRFFNDVVRGAADQALLNNWFLKLNLDKNGNIIDNDGIDPIYISTLSLSPEEIVDFNKKQPSSLQRLQKIQRGLFESITLQFFGDPYDGTKNFISRDEINDPRIVYNDPLIANLYVEENYLTESNPYFLYEFNIPVIQNNIGQVPDIQKASPYYSDAETLTEEEIYSKYTQNEPNETALNTIKSFNVPFKRDYQKLYFLTQFTSSWADVFRKIASSAASTVSGSLKGGLDLVGNLFSSSRTVVNNINNLNKSIELLRAPQEPRSFNPKAEQEDEEKVNDIIRIQTATEQIFSNGGYVIFGNLDQWSSSIDIIKPNFEFFKGLASIGDIPVDSPIYSPDNSIFDPRPRQATNAPADVKGRIRNGLYGNQIQRGVRVTNLTRFEYETNLLPEKKNNGICDGTLIEKNSRYFNWSINQPTWNSSMLKVKSTIDKTLYQTLKRYKNDPDTVLREQGNK